MDTFLFLAPKHVRVTLSGINILNKLTLTQARISCQMGYEKAFGFQSLVNFEIVGDCIPEIAI